MRQIFKRIWDLALPYQDKRNDKGHANVTLKFVLRLLKSERGDAEIVIPAIILHDIGWSKVSKKEWMLLFHKSTPKSRIRVIQLKHQEESVRLGKNILNRVNYPRELMQEILQIVGEHDTRNGFISHNDGLVRDADKLWRFSRKGFNIDLGRFEASFSERYKTLKEDIESKDYFHSKTARDMARKELELRKDEFRPAKNKQLSISQL